MLASFMFFKKTCTHEMLFEFSFVEFLDNGLELFCNMQEPLDNVLGLIFISNVVLKYTKTQFFFQGRLLKLWIG
jgi:hypothetical protein